MRRTILGFMSTVSALVLLFSYHTSTNTQSAGASVIGPATISSATPSATAATAATAGTANTSSSAATTAGTYTGSEVSTRWGLVQVRITVENGSITTAQAVEYPSGNRKDQEINAYAVPALNQEAVQNQSAKIDAVSGATVTSNGYIQSLQSAIDQANL